MDRKKLMKCKKPELVELVKNLKGGDRVQLSKLTKAGLVEIYLLDIKKRPLQIQEDILLNET